MRHITLILFLLLCFPLQSISAEIAAHGLTLSYSRDARICGEASKLLSDDKSCRPFDVGRCVSDEETSSILVRGERLFVFEEIAANEYGYTQVYRSIGSSLNGFAIIYVQRFQGDNFPRLVETWKVDASDFDEVMKLSPGPISSKSWVPYPSRETNALEFDKMLKRGEKLTDEWSPVIDIFGEPYLIERECSGREVYGGYYVCNRVIKLTVKKLTKGKKTVPYCQFSKVKKK